MSAFGRVFGMGTNQALFHSGANCLDPVLFPTTSQMMPVLSWGQASSNTLQ